MDKANFEQLRNLRNTLNTAFQQEIKEAIVKVLEAHNIAFAGVILDGELKVVPFPEKPWCDVELDVVIDI